MAQPDVTLAEEWLECRVTIGRFDGYLADIRKYGFTLVTLLLTASALVTTPPAKAMKGYVSGENFVVPLSQ